MKSTAIASGALTGTTTLMTGKSTVNSVQLIADGTNAATVTLYDNTAGSGKILAVLSLPATGTQQSIVYVNAIRCDIGLTAVVTGTGAAAYVGYNG